MARRLSSKIAIAALLASSSFVKADSSVFSQFIGATATTYLSSGAEAQDFTICTNLVHDFPALTSLSQSQSMQIFQQEVDNVCELCPSLGLSRIDSCCPQATSSACFAAFGAQNAATTTPANIVATTTATISTTGATKTSSADRIHLHNGIIFGSIACTLGMGGWLSLLGL